MEPWVALLDCNNFFVSCERLFRPDLQGKPVAVLSSNDGCVVARSKEVKDIGIPMGIPVFQIKDIIKDNNVITFSSHFTLYRDVSRRVFEVLRREVDVIEQYSIDEAFFSLKGTADTVLQRAKNLKDIIEREVGIPVSIGLAKSKTLAKYASAQAKKTSGTAVLSMDEWHVLSKSVLLSELWGVGTKTSQSFREQGLHTVHDFLAVERRSIEALYGVVGVRLQMELSGQNAITLHRSLGSQKSILHTRSFKATTSDSEVIKDAISYHLREATEDLRSMNFLTNTLTVYLGTSRHGDYLLRGGSKTFTLQTHTDDTFALLALATTGVDELFEADVPYKKAGVMLTGFIPKEGAQMSFFADEREVKTKALMPMIDAVNERIGKGSLQLGTRLREDAWQSSQIKKSPAYTTSWKHLAIVKA